MPRIAPIPPLGALFDQHNEHRIFLPRALMLGLHHLSAFDTRWPMFGSWICLAVAAVPLYREIRSDRQISWFAFAPITWLLFSLRQQENLLWGWQLQICMCAMLVITSLALLSRSEKSDATLAGAIAAGVGASFSFSTGLLVWPAGLFQCLLQSQSSGRWRGRLALWCAAGAAVYLFYFHGYRKPAGHPSMLLALRSPGTLIEYFLVSIGTPLTTNVAYAMAIGVLLVIGSALCFWVVRMDRGGHLAPGIGPGLVIFSLGTSATLAVARSGFGVPQALASRYCTLTAFALIGLYLTVLRLRRLFRVPASVGLVCLVLLIVAGTIQGNADGVIWGRQTRAARQAMRADLFSFDAQPDSVLATIYPNPAVIRERAPLLRARNLSVFSTRCRRVSVVCNR